MRALIQRVTSASVVVDGAITGEIGAGLLILVCAMQGDSDKQVDWLARKCVNLRIFSDENGKMNRSVADIGGAALIVSQFTLAAETKGNRPGFSRAAVAGNGHEALRGIFSGGRLAWHPRRQRHFRRRHEGQPDQ